MGYNSIAWSSQVVSTPSHIWLSALNADTQVWSQGVALPPGKKKRSVTAGGTQGEPHRTAVQPIAPLEERGIIPWEQFHAVAST